MKIYKSIFAVTLAINCIQSSALELVKEVAGYRTDWFSPPTRGQGNLKEIKCNARSGFSYVHTLAQYPKTFSQEQLTQVWEDDKALKEESDWYVRFDSTTNMTRIFARKGIRIPAKIAMESLGRGGPAPKPAINCTSRAPVVGAPGKRTVVDILVELAGSKEGPTIVRLPNGYGTAPAVIAIDEEYYVLRFSFKTPAERQTVIAAFDSYMTQGLFPYEESDSVSPVGRAVRDQVIEARWGQEYVTTVVDDPAQPGVFELNVSAKKAKKH